jgi:hypothetical protein
VNRVHPCHCDRLPLPLHSYRLAVAICLPEFAQHTLLVSMCRNNPAVSYSTTTVRTVVLCPPIEPPSSAPQLPSRASAARPIQAGIIAEPQLAIGRVLGSQATLVKPPPKKASYRIAQYSVGSRLGPSFLVARRITAKDAILLLAPPSASRSSSSR